MPSACFLNWNVLTVPQEEAKETTYFLYEISNDLRKSFHSEEPNQSSSPESTNDVLDMAHLKHGNGFHLLMEKSSWKGGQYFQCLIISQHQRAEGKLTTPFIKQLC